MSFIDMEGTVDTQPTGWGCSSVAGGLPTIQKSLASLSAPQDESINNGNLLNSKCGLREQQW